MADDLETGGTLEHDPEIGGLVPDGAPVEELATELTVDPDPAATPATTAAPEAEPVKAEPTIEDQARANGWKPLGEWKGDTSAHVTADEFVKRGIKSKSLLKDERDGLVDEVRSMRRDMSDFRAQSEREKAEIVARTMAEAQRRFQADAQEARAKGDFDAFEAANKEAIEAGVRAQLAQQQHNSQVENQPNPDYDAFVLRNPWYDRNPAMAVLADQVGKRITQTKGIVGGQLLTEVETAMRESHPHLFENPKRREAAAVDSSVVVAGAGGKSVRDLGPEYTSAFSEYFENFGGQYGGDKSKAERAYVKMITGE